MMKIGFVDLFIDEWHANNYPRFIAESAYGKEFSVHMAWEESPKKGGMDLKIWCKENKVSAASSISGLIDACDCIAVLAPSNPEVHARLSELPLKSGKPVYIDKPFAPDLKTAESMFRLAEKHKTPLMSSSALRYGSEIQNFIGKTLLKDKAGSVAVRGGGTSFGEYSIHQIEMLVMLMGTGAEKVMQCGTQSNDIMIVQYKDGRRASVNRYLSQSFGISVAYGEDKFFSADNMGDFFPQFTNAMLKFFKTGKSLIPKEETLEIIRIMNAGIRALENLDKWVEIQ